MISPPDISIVTVNFNGLQDTCEMIVSLQTHLHRCTYEIIVVDNGSRQNEAALIQQRFPSIRTIRSEKNRGFAGGNNLGTREARGKYIFFLNNDTYVEDDTIFYLCETLTQDPKIAAVSPKIKFASLPQHIQYAGFTHMSRYTLRNKSIGYNEPDKKQYNHTTPTAFLHGAAMMVRQDILEKVGPMPEIYFLYYEEMDWCSHIINKGYQLYYEPRCTIYHKESKSTGSASPLKTYYLTRNRLLYAWRNRRRISRIIALLYQLGIAIPKNLIVNLFSYNVPQLKAIIKGGTDFIRLKNKTL